MQIKIRAFNNIASKVRNYLTFMRVFPEGRYNIERLIEN